MNFQPARPRVLFAADSAFVGFFTRVDELVGLQVALRDERFAASIERAHEWSVAGMSPHVRLETARVTKLFDAVAERAEQVFVGRARTSKDLEVSLPDRLLVVVELAALPLDLNLLLALVETHLRIRRQRNVVSVDN